MKYVKVYDCMVMQDIPDVVVFNSQNQRVYNLCFSSQIKYLGCKVSDSLNLTAVKSVKRSFNNS